MNTCLIHSQSYPQDGFCVYCGPPQNTTVGGGTTVGLYQCLNCGEWIYSGVVHSCVRAGSVETSEVSGS